MANGGMEMLLVIICWFVLFSLGGMKQIVVTLSGW